jgi:hypothetical protein
MCAGDLQPFCWLSNSGQKQTALHDATAAQGVLGLDAQHAMRHGWGDPVGSLHATGLAQTARGIV